MTDPIAHVGMTEKEHAEQTLRLAILSEGITKIELAFCSLHDMLRAPEYDPKRTQQCMEFAVELGRLSAQAGSLAALRSSTMQLEMNRLRPGSWNWYRDWCGRLDA